MPAPDDITRLLRELREGKEGAEEALMPRVYDELHALAKHYMRTQRPGHTLQTTALVHEAYMKLGGVKEASFESKAHYFRVAAKAMRSVLVDYARRKGAEKKGGKRKRESLEEAAPMTEESTVDLLALDETLSRLSEIDTQMGQVVELRYFGGLTVEETARVLSISPTTVKHDWMMARAWLMQEMG